MRKTLTAITALALLVGAAALVGVPGAAHADRKNPLAGQPSLRHRLGDVAYNVVFHSAPYRATGEFHWHVHVLPKVTTRAGFELGTGVLINVVAPELAASELRAAATAI